MRVSGESAVSTGGLGGHIRCGCGPVINAGSNCGQMLVKLPAKVVASPRRRYVVGGHVGRSAHAVALWTLPARSDSSRAVARRTAGAAAPQNPGAPRLSG